MTLSRLPPPDQLADALLAGRGEVVLEAAHRYMAEGGAPFVADALVRPAMEVVGERWSRGSVSVAEEHAATELLGQLLTHLLHGPAWHAGAPGAVIACAPGEHHSLGARLVSQVLAFDGWHVRFLGADTPARDLALFVAREQPVFVGLSVTQPEHLPEARLTLELLHRTTPHIPLIAGGLAAAALGTGKGQPWRVLGSARELLSWARAEAVHHPSLR